VTDVTGDSSDEVSNLSWPDRHWLRWLTLTCLGFAGVVPTSSVNRACSLLSNTANLRLVEHIEFFWEYSGRVKWTTHTGFLDAYAHAISVDATFQDRVRRLAL